MGGHHLGSLNFTNKPSLQTFAFNTQALTKVYTTTGNYSAAIQLNNANQYNRTDLCYASPLSVIGSCNTTISCNNQYGNYTCSVPCGFTPCCSQTYSPGKCGYSVSGGAQCNANN